jgi:N-acetylmuramoyl-L-alanine amidase
MTDLQALILTLLGEARGEPIEGKIAVAMVIRNRVLSKYGGAQTYADVCLAKAQFSAWTEEAAQMHQADIELSGGHADPTLAICEEIARATITGTLADNTGGANHYLTTALLKSTPPNWAKGVTGREIGAQTFMRLA